MNLSINILILLVVFLFYVILFLIIKIIMNKFKSLDEVFVSNNKRLALILSILSNHNKFELKTLKEIRNVTQNIVVENIQEHLQSKSILKIEKQEIKKLHKFSKIARKEASVYLGLIASEKSRLALENALLEEKNYSVKIYISNALTDIKDPKSLDIMIYGIINTKKWYREKAISNILEFGYEVQKHFLQMKDTKDFELIELWINYAKENFNNDTKEYLFHFVSNYNDIKNEIMNYYGSKLETSKNDYRSTFLDTDLDGLLAEASRVLSNYYYDEFGSERYYHSKNMIIQTNALWALSKINSTDNFEKILSFISYEEHEKTVISVLSKMVELNPHFLYLLENKFEQESSEVIKGRIAQILSNKIEYYILKLNQKNDYRSEQIIIEIIKNHKINELIGFLNLNKDYDIENRLVDILRTNVPIDSELAIELRTYLKKELIDKWGTEPIYIKRKERKVKKDYKLVRMIMLFTFITIAMFPAIFLLSKSVFFETSDIRSIVKYYVIEFNYYLVYYSVIINSIYIILLILSFQNVKRQSRLWNLKNISMLFRNKMMPSVSIIAPAYNEEKTIAESTKSLLHLNYPEYELIIVNDGSTDETLNILIKEFKLVRVDYSYTATLDTAPILGIYRNPSFPKLIVINKINAGKADSLNAGINLANKTYFCGIDADSLLEPDSLLKLASLTLDESVEIPALGGNIFPINGCTVDKGLVTDIKIPRNQLARFQTIEYLRSFMAGRLGWEKLNCLLIISGAFGLFRKNRILDVGGYLTESGKYKKDTVGEDMELIVRINRFMYELKHPFKIKYSFNANCWTEVPEDFKSLRNQRFRWHRGLIDILYFHRKMLFNPNYGTTGLIALPYFLIFEAIGPMIEIQGYLMVVLAALLGILNISIALLLFISVILFGIIISLTALLIAEKEIHYFSFRDIGKLMTYAILENFGVKQLLNYWRLRGQLSVLFGHSGWGYIKRKGQKNE